MYNSSNTKYDKLKEYYNKYLVSVQEESTAVFDVSSRANVGIYVFDKHKTTKDVDIQLFKDKFTNSEYEEEMFKYLLNEHPNFMPFRPIGDDKKKFLESYTDRYITRFTDKDILLITNLANGRRNATFISRAVGQICNKEEFKQLMMSRDGSCCAVLKFNSKKAAENCKSALLRPLMRFGLYKLQDDQSMTARVYKYVPDIDWSNSKCKTDEGILEMCGCPKEKAKEYVQYCKEIIDKVDGK